jgi:hypothetical protein
MACTVLADNWNRRANCRAEALSHVFPTASSKRFENGASRQEQHGAPASPHIPGS